MRKSFFAAILTLLLLGAPVVYAQAEPLVTIISPTADEQIEVGQPVVLNFKVGNFTFVNPGSSNPSPSAGYAVVWTDISDKRQAQENGRLLTSEGFVNLGQLSPGEHTITVGLFRPDGSQMDPKTSGSTTFTIGVFQKGGVSGFYPAFFILIGMVIAIILTSLIATFIYRERLKKHRLVVAAREKYGEYDTINRIKEHRLTNKIKEAYERLRKKN